jgi:DNA-binding NarL/FixJ family response regulator
MNETINVLLVDDHPLRIDAYKNSLKQIGILNTNYNFDISSAVCCDSALLKFKNAMPTKAYDLAFLDIRLPSKNSKITSGEELAVIFKRLNPNLKLVIVTGHYDVFVFQSILQNINPDGLVYKSDVGIEVFNMIIENVFKNVPFYSDTVLQLLRKNISSKITLTDIDKQLLYHLSRGSKTKDLKKYLPLSQGGIEKRKRLLKEVFKTQKLDDEALLRSAEKKGFS